MAFSLLVAAVPLLSFFKAPGPLPKIRDGQVFSSRPLINRPP